jgi:hypothetical protein
MATTLVVDIEDRPHPKFKWNPFKFVEVEPLGAFSFVPHGVLHVEEIKFYVHANIEELRRTNMLNLYSKKMLGENFSLKLAYEVFEEKGFAQIS